MANGAIPDEEWDRFLDDVRAESHDAPKEPSARARMVTRRLRENPGEPDGWRTYEPPRRRGKGRYLVGLIVSAALLAGVVTVGPDRVAGWFSDRTDEQLPAETRQPSRPPAEAVAQVPTVADPFRGSPAQRWADGADGIHVPPARATGWMTQEQVATALQQSRRFLTASSTDPAVLQGDYPAEAIALLNPLQQDIQAYLTAAFTAPSKKNNPLVMFSRFDPRQVRLAGNVVKARGRMTLREGERGAVEISTDVTYVYPLVRTTAGNDEVARTVVRREVVMNWNDPTRVRTKPGTLSIVSYKVDATNGGCDGFNGGYFVPTFDTERDAANPGDGPTVDPYDRSKTMDERIRESGDAHCGTATRS